MNIQRATPVNEFLAKLIFLMLPTAAIGFYLLNSLNVRYAILQNEAWLQSLYMAAGMGAAALIYSFRVRFLPTYIALLVVLFSTYKGMDAFSTSEFSFFASVRFLVFSILFSTGWLIGWGYIRLRYFAVLISVSLLTACIATIATAKVDTVEALLIAFIPTIAYVIYNIFTAEQIYNYKDKSKKFWWFLIRRLSIFGVLLGMLLWSVVFFMRKDIKETVAQYGGGGKKGGNNMMKQNKDGTFDLKDYSKLSNSLNRDKQLLFCAHIDNYFPGTKYPNPLYLTAFYFTKFDTTTETFERDATIPYNDLFEPDPSKIPLFGTKQDTMVIHNSLGNKARTIVDVEIYNCNLSPSTYLAPNVGFFVQPITVEKDFREKFRSAYRTKSYVSSLNSAYFVYNMDTPVMRQFQEARFKVLRTAGGYEKVDPKFMSYYTYMPSGDKFKSITALAHRVTDTAHTPVDKVIAIRNYFLSKNENGEHLYKYTDNPGEPDIPNASKLLYFLNENHKGYCAYYAGATLFMLRSIGIPSRIAVGFLTEDRSDKNKGWYWYYANQAHAWIQVYFPGFGWLDFDTTVGNSDSENRPTPQPDGTPPMQPPKAWLAAEGVVESTDTVKKTMQFTVKHYVFHDKEYKPEQPVSISLDMKVSSIFRDSMTIPFAKVQKGDEGTAVSYAEILKKIEPSDNENATSLINSLPMPTPIDEVYLKNKTQVAPKELQKKVAEVKKVSKRQLLWIGLGLLGAFLVVMLLLPEIVLRYFIYKYNHTKAENDKPYWAYRAATYYLHMIGISRGNRTPMQYAKQSVDPFYSTSFGAFMNVYLKKKYAKQELNERERLLVDEFLKPFLAAVNSKTAFSDKFFEFMNVVRMAGFFTMPPEEEKEV
ncbi:hypothetical protein CJD36_019470 [Flavipsychrobacter stenotrophus]|uniref:Transglutaminase-like domain-containing protein n=1 Tax=Flavipsychrobacter stenotrophus TaxID=2077091 RepID=A0A2S7SRQ4_9BACT|nr:transglutaminase-like domain-containing protein [Flavipsychrobacter stenotrophus]PQJ09424.1 hypothetical protein CJD36_019470 [Flavipsychrobacter stenotrophus]